MRSTTQLWIVIIGLLAYGTVLVGAEEAIPIPAPFDRYTEVELNRQVYPQFNPQTRLLGKNIVDDEGKARAGQFYAAKSWKGEGDVKLLILIETYTAENDERPFY